MLKAGINVSASYFVDDIYYSIVIFVSGWFGIRKDFCTFILGACPLLQEYANIAYHSERQTNGVEMQQTEKREHNVLKKADLLKPVLPIISIEMPDWFYKVFTIYLSPKYKKKSDK